jgi:hypothetical protein
MPAILTSATVLGVALPKLIALSIDLRKIAIGELIPLLFDLSRISFQFPSTRFQPIFAIPNRSACFFTIPVDPVSIVLTGDPTWR